MSRGKLVRGEISSLISPSLLRVRPSLSLSLAQPLVWGKGGEEKLPPRFPRLNRKGQALSFSGGIYLGGFTTCFGVRGFEGEPPGWKPSFEGDGEDIPSSPLL